MPHPPAFALKMTKKPRFRSFEGTHPRSFRIDPFVDTRSCAALRAADLDWIVGPEYSLGGKEEGVQGRNKQKRDSRGVRTDLLDV